MQYTEQHKAEALQILEACTPKQWASLYSFASLITRKPTPEEQQEQEAKERKKQEEREQRIAKKEAEESDFIAWKEKRLRGFKFPSQRYDIDNDDVNFFVGYLGFYGLQIERAYNAVCALYDYGFKRGMNYQTNKGKVKGKATI